VNARQALVCEPLGGASGLKIVEAPAPAAGPREAVAEVAYVALVKGADILGAEWAKFAALEPEQDRVNMSRVTRWAAEGKLATHIHSVHELADFEAAFAEIADRRALGEALLKLHPLFTPKE
jgi:NADPH:quinone reductase-like Zn-dependent oxidoreductase